MQSGMIHDGGGIEVASGAAVTSGALSLLADVVRRGGDGDPKKYLVVLDPVSGHPVRLVQARLDGSLTLVEPSRSSRSLPRPVPGTRRV